MVFIAGLIVVFIAPFYLRGLSAAIAANALDYLPPEAARIEAKHSLQIHHFTLH